jgi:hypothetical protein
MTTDEQTSDREASHTEPTLTAPRSLWDLLIVLAALIGLIVLTGLTMRHYAGNATNAATILGIVVPAFATIGAAAFGITVAYSAGQAKGQAAGQADKAKAVEAARGEVAEQLTPRIESVRSALRQVRTVLDVNSFSPPGQETMFLGVRPTQASDRPAAIRVEPEPLEFDPAPLEQARQELDRLHGVVESLAKTSPSDDES